MGGSKKKGRPGGKASTRKPAVVLSIVVLASLAVVASVFFVLREGPKESSKQGVSGETGESGRLSSSAGDQKTLQKLVGRWLRPDGGYVIEIRKIDVDGRMDAAYFNPRPIHVSRAVAMTQGEETKVFIELQDVGYPGSSYTLTCYPQKDVLAGIYHQAAMGQDFEVVFVRMK